MPLVQTVAFKNRGYTEVDAPIACEVWKQLVTLPIHPRLETETLIICWMQFNKFYHKNSYFFFLLKHS